MREVCQRFGMTVPDVEPQVFITVPDNVWFHLHDEGFYMDTPDRTGLYVLELLNAMYGLVDDPILWSMALRYFIINDIQGKPSRYDENFFYWTSTDAHGLQSIAAVVATHVDDLVVPAAKNWLAESYSSFIAKIGKVTRQDLPFVNVGMGYSRLPHGDILQKQVKCAEALKPIVLSATAAQAAQTGGAKPLDAARLTQPRGGIGAVL